MSTAIPTPDPNLAAWNIYVDNQNFNVTSLTGEPTTLSLADINSFTKFLLVQTSIYGVSVGTTGIMMIVLLVYCDKKKARKPIFIVNFLGLLCQCVRNIIAIAGSCNLLWYGIGEIYLGGVAQFSMAERTYRTIIFSIFSSIFYALILASLIIQIRAVFVPQLARQRTFVTIILSFIAFVIVSCWTAYQVLVILTTYVVIYEQEYYTKPLTPLYNTTQGGVTAFVGLACLFLVVKLYVAVRRRHSLGFQQMGPMHVPLIVFVQCLIIPCTISLNNR